MRRTRSDERYCHKSRLRDKRQGGRDVLRPPPCDSRGVQRVLVYIIRGDECPKCDGRPGLIPAMLAYSVRAHGSPRATALAHDAQLVNDWRVHPRRCHRASF